MTFDANFSPNSSFGPSILGRCESLAHLKNLLFVYELARPIPHANEISDSQVGVPLICRSKASATI